MTDLDHRISRHDAIGLEVVFGQLVQGSDDARDEGFGIALFHGGAQPVGDDGARRIGPDRAGDAERDLDALGDPARHGDEEVGRGQEVRAAQDIQGDDPVLDPVGPHDHAAAVRSPGLVQFDHAPQAEPDAAGVRPDLVHRTAGAVDAIGAQFAGRLGQFGQVQRNDPAAFHATAAGPAREKGK